MAWRSFRRPRQTPSEYVFPVTFSMVRRHAAKSIQRTSCLQSVKGNELCVLARFEFSPLSQDPSPRAAHGFSSLVFLHRPEQPIISSGQSWVRAIGCRSSKLLCKVRNGVGEVLNQVEHGAFCGFAEQVPVVGHLATLLGRLPMSGFRMPYRSMFFWTGRSRTECST